MLKLRDALPVLLFLVLAFATLYFAAAFLVPLALAAVLSMVFIKLCNYFERKGASRAVASLYCLLILMAAGALILGMLSIQLGSLAENLDGMEKRLFALLDSVQKWIDETVGIERATQDEIIDKGTKGKSSAMVLSFAAGLLGVLANTVLVLVYVYLFLSLRGHIKKFVLKLVPRKDNEDVSDLVHQVGHVAQQYLSGMAAMIGLLWVMYGIGFSIVGVESAIFFAILCGLLEIVPFVGNLTGTALTLFAVMGQGGDSKMIIGVLVTYFLVQFIQTYLLEPIIVGEQVNINPLFTIMGIVLGEQIWGIAGMILALPLLGMLKIVCDGFPVLQPYGYLIGPENPHQKRTKIIDAIKKLWNSKS